LHFYITTQVLLASSNVLYEYSILTQNFILKNIFWSVDFSQTLFMWYFRVHVRIIPAPLQAFLYFLYKIWQTGYIAS